MAKKLCYLFVFVFFYNYGMNCKRLFSESCTADSKRLCMIQGQEAVIQDLLEHVQVARLKHVDFRYEHCDVPFINSVIQVTKNCIEQSIENIQGYRIIEHAFKVNIYHKLAQYIADRNIISVKKSLYNPNRLLEVAIEENGNGDNAELALKLGACPNVILLYPLVRHNDIEQVYVCGVSKYTREVNMPRLRLLIKFGVFLNIRNKEENPLYCALVEARRGMRDLINVLLYHGADPQLHFTEDVSGVMGRTPLECAEQMVRVSPYNSLYPVLSNLLKKGHERRSHRMATYLFRVINGCGYKVVNGKRVIKRRRLVEEPLGINGTEFPLELCYHIVEMNYGKLHADGVFERLKDNSKVNFTRKGRAYQPLTERIPAYCLRRVQEGLLHD